MFAGLLRVLSAEGCLVRAAAEHSSALRTSPGNRFFANSAPALCRYASVVDFPYGTILNPPCVFTLNSQC